MMMLPKSPCDPTPPTLEWYETQDGGIYYPKESAAQLLNYIHDLKECAVYTQTNPKN